MTYARSIILAMALALTSMCPSTALAGGGHDDGHHDEHEHHEDEHDHHGDEHGHEEEGVVTIPREALSAERVEVREAGPAKLATKLKVSGRVSPVSSKVAHIAPRFSGIIKEVRKETGDYVKAGDVLALVESNQTLQPFEVRTLKAGVITERHATVGESVKDDETLFVVMDLSEVWAEFTVFQRDIARVQLSQPIVIFLAGREEPYRSAISLISPVVDESTQSRVVRAVVSAPDSRFAPGAFITGEIAVAEYQVPLAITYEAIQTIEGKPVAFVQHGESFEKREITLGRSDGVLTEVLSGIEAGERYAAMNTFILKADLQKSEAEHQH